jgi:hypothetical protein
MTYRYNCSRCRTSNSASYLLKLENLPVLVFDRIPGRVCGHPCQLLSDPSNVLFTHRTLWRSGFSAVRALPFLLVAMLVCERLIVRFARVCKWCTVIDPTVGTSRHALALPRAPYCVLFAFAFPVTGKVGVFDDFNSQVREFLQESPEVWVVLQFVQTSGTCIIRGLALLSGLVPT